MNLADIMLHAEREMDTFQEAYQRSPNKGHSEKYRFWREVWHACKSSQDLLDAYGLTRKDGHE